MPSLPAVVVPVLSGWIMSDCLNLLIIQISFLIKRVKHFR